MRHGIKGRKLNRKSSHRKALLSSLACSLVEHEQIVTTLPKAKELRPYVEKLVTLGKKDTLHSRRTALSRLKNNNKAVQKIFSTLSERYKSRNGGYIRIMKAGFRTGDSAPVAVIEFVDRDMSARGKYDRELHAAKMAELAEEEEV